MKPQVLITREEADCFEFKNLLSGENCEVICNSFIETKTANVGSIPGGDWVFFASPRAVKHYFEVSKSLKNQKFAALSSGTAKELKKYVRCDFEGRETALESVEAFKKILKPGETIIIPRSNKSVRRLQQVLDENRYVEFILYFTLPLIKKLPKTPEIAVFTSPGNVSAYCKSGNELPKNTVAIGETTAAEILKNGPEPLISKGYTPANLARAVMQFL